MDSYDAHPSTGASAAGPAAPPRTRREARRVRLRRGRRPVEDPQSDPFDFALAGVRHAAGSGASWTGLRRGRPPPRGAPARHPRPAHRAHVRRVGRRPRRGRRRDAPGSGRVDARPGDAEPGGGAAARRRWRPAAAGRGHGREDRGRRAQAAARRTARRRRWSTRRPPRARPPKPASAPTVKQPPTVLVPRPGGAPRPARDLGPDPGTVRQIQKMGAAKWLEWQLKPSHIAEPAARRST